MFTALAKNTMLDALTPDRAGVMAKQANKAVTGVAATDLFTSAAHGYGAGDLVVFSALTGGAGLVAGRPYFVIASGLTANDFRVSTVPGGATIDITTALTAGTVNKFAEPGAPYARVVIAFAAASAGVRDDTTNGAVVTVPGGVNVDAECLWNNATGGLLLFNALTTAGDASNWTYTFTDAILQVTD